MENKFYGVKDSAVANLDLFDAHVEELKILGYTIVENLIDAHELDKATQLLDKAYAKQLKDFGEERLKMINETNLVRCPLAYDDIFLQLATKPLLMDLVKHFLGNYFIINQQNGIINFPNEIHHQSSWH